MEKNLPNAEAEVTPEVTPEAEEPKEEVTPEVDSSKEADLSELLEKEKGRGKPDPEKAKERFAKKHNAGDDADDADDGDDEDRPMSRREAREFLAQQGQQTLVEANTERIIDYSESVAESATEAELIREIHKNRVFPAGMSLREQIDESSAIVNYKRAQAKAAELARTVKGAGAASTDAATTQRDPQAGGGPKVSSDLVASMQRSGFTLNNKTQRYEKTLPNGKILVKEPEKAPYLVN